MKYLVFIAASLVSCDGTTDVAEDKHKAAQDVIAIIERPYAKCMIGNASRFGDTDKVTQAQARQVADMCKSQLEHAINEGSRSKAFHPKDPDLPWPSHFQSWANGLENSYMRKISNDVLPLPVV